MIALSVGHQGSDLDYFTYVGLDYFTYVKLTCVE